MKEATATTLENAPKVGSKQWCDYKANVCQEALNLKKKIEKLQARFGEVQGQLKLIFAEDPKQFFCEDGTVDLTKSNSYSIDESKISEVKVVLSDNNLVVDDYINQKTSWGLTPKMRSLIKDSENVIGTKLKPFVTITESSSLTIKTA